ncbi:IS3 family transposase [Burkholderia oklahomensis]
MNFVRAIDDGGLPAHVGQAWLESGCAYGYRQIHGGMREQRARCRIDRIARLMCVDGLACATRPWAPPRVM